MSSTQASAADERSARAATGAEPEQPCNAECQQIPEQQKQVGPKAHIHKGAHGCYSASKLAPPPDPHGELQVDHGKVNDYPPEGPQPPEYMHGLANNPMSSKCDHHELDAKIAKKDAAT